MSDTPIRRTNWTINPHGGDADDPLAELERIIARSPASAPMTPQVQAKAPAAAPQNNNSTLMKDDFLGFSQHEFEAAFRAIEKPAPAPPVREGAIFKKEPTFTEPAPQAEYSRSFAQTFEQEMAPAPAQVEEQEFETRADAFDFDTRTLGAAQPAYQDFDMPAQGDIEPAYYMENRPRSGFVTVIGVTGLVFVAVIGALVYSWVGAKNTGEPVVITADKSPVKKMAAADTDQPAQNKLIYDRLGSSEDDGSNDKVVSREEQPVDNLKTEADEPAPPTAEEEDPALPPPAPRVILPNPSSASSAPTPAPAADTTTPSAPRQVATTTIRVRPDGTMENVPSGIADTTTPTQPTQVKPNITPSPVLKAMAPPVASDETATAAPEVTTPVKTKQPVSLMRTASLPPTAPPVTKTAKTTAATATASATTGGYVVQISSQKSEDSARSSFTSMQSRFPQVLSTYQPSIKAVEIGNKGTFYRVRVGPMANRDDASALCTKLKAAGGDCVVTPN